MKTEIIKEIKIDSKGRLKVVPSKQSFSLIYRSAMEIHWDNTENCLYAPEKMKDWSYEDWFKDDRDKELDEFVKTHGDFYKYKSAMAQIAGEPGGENLTLQELYDKAKEQVDKEEENFAYHNK